MKTLFVRGHADINYYTKSIITVVGVDYLIVEASYEAVTGRWALLVKKAA